LEKIETGLEQDILGMMMINSDIIAPVSEILTVEDFSVHTHKTIYKTILNMYIENRGQPIEIILLINNLASKLSQTPQEIKATVKKYMESVASTLNYKSVAEKIKDYSISRQVREHCHEVVLSVNADNARETVTNLCDNMGKLLQANKKDGLKPVSDLIINYYQDLFNPDTVELIKTGYSGLDNILGGCERSDLTIIAARTGIGKSTFALNIATSLIKRKYNVAFFSLEMTRKQVLNKLTSSIGKIPFEYIKNHNMSRYNVEAAKAADFLSKYGEHLYIDERSGLTVQDIRMACLAKKIDVIIVDYLQLLTPSNSKTSRNDQVGEMSRALKIMAGDLNAWVICLSQLNRDIEKRGNKSKPVLSDLRDSGNIEQDANEVIFLSKENPEDDDSDIRVDVAKSRFGKLGECPLHFNRQCNLFMTIDTRYEVKQPKKNDDIEFVPNEY